MDRDHDGYLNNEELNTFQLLCFKKPLPENELKSVKEVIAKGTQGQGLVESKGVNEIGYVVDDR